MTHVAYKDSGAYTDLVGGGLDMSVGTAATAQGLMREGRVRVNPAGEILSEEAWQAGQGDWLCNDDDYDHINSLMKPCFEAGQYASWIAPPRVGINNQPQDFEYVRIEHS